MADGTRFSAELVTFDEATGIAQFKPRHGADFTHNESKLSVVDRGWLREWVTVGIELEKQLEESGGTVEHLLTEGKYPTDIFIYHPPGIAEADLAKRPLFIAFHPSGKAHRYLGRFTDAASKLGFSVASCETFRNTGNNDEQEAAMLARLKEVLPQLEKQIHHDPKKLIMGGTSGGAWRAFHYTAWIDRPWLGVFSNGGWLGGQIYYHLPYPAGMRVTWVNGDKDYGPNIQVKPDTKILTDRGSKTVYFSFDGGHQVPPNVHIHDAFKWILKDQEPAAGE